MPAGDAVDSFDEGSAVEVDERPDAFTTVFEDADGTRALLVSSVPVNFEDGLGGWKKIDNRVVSDGAGGLTNAANEWRVTFGVMQTGRGVMISTSDGDLSFVADGARAVPPMVEPDGVSVRYVDVFADTDLMYVVTGVGVEELLVLKSAKGTSAVTFSIVGAQFDANPSGLESRSGGIGRRVTISAPETFDGDGRPVAVEHQVFSNRDDGAGKSKVTVGVTAEFLRSLPADAFPLTVDPSVGLWLGTSWLHSYGNYLSTGAWYDSFSDGYARVGNPLISSTSSVRWRTTGFFDYHPYIGASVVDAALYTTMVVGGSTSRTLNVYWANQDSFNYGMNPRWHTQSTPPSSAYTLTTTNPYVTSTLGAVGTAAWHNGTWFPTLYNNWTRTSHLNGTLLFRGNESAGINTYKKFTVAVLLVINRWPSLPASSWSRGQGLVTPPPAWTPLYDAASMPTSWFTGQPQTFPVTVTNGGTEIWPAGGATPVRLGFHFATAAGANPPWLTDGRVDLPQDLAPGASVTLQVTATPPAGFNGNVVLEVRMVKEMQFWFSQAASRPVTVSALSAAAASYDTASMPILWSVGQPQTFPVTVTNSGTETWTAGGANPVQLGLHFATVAGANPPWLTDSRFVLPQDLAPGASVTLQVTATPPAGATGNVVLEVRMVKEGQFWFTQAASRPVTVTSTPGPVITWSATTSSDADGDTVQYLYRPWHDVNKNGALDAGEPSMDVGWTTATSASVTVPASWAGPHIRTQLYNWDGMVVAGEYHMNGTVLPKSPNQPPPAPVIANPTVGSTIISLTPTLSVNPSVDPNSDPVKYQFWACKHPSTPITPLPADCRTTGLTTATSWTLPASFVVWNEPYTWWVASYDEDLWSTTNSVGSFMASYTAAQIAAIGAGYNPYSADAEGVDTANGNYRITRTDVTVPGVGADLSIARTLDTALITGAVAINGAFGMGWTFQLDMRARKDAAGNGFITMPDGSEQFFGKNADGSYSRTLGSGNTLTKDPVGTVPREWHLTDVSGTRYDFDADLNPGMLKRVTDKAGRVVQVIWSQGDTVQQFLDVASGRSLTLTYTIPAGATRAHVSQVATASVAAHGGALVWKYYYSADLLTKVCDPRDNSQTGKCEVYGYDGSGRMTTITGVAGNVHTTLTYDGSNRVLTLKNAYNNTWTYSYAASDITITPPAPSPPFSVRRTTVTDARGNIVFYDFDAARRLVHRVDSYTKERWYTYDGNGFLAQTINELGEVEQYLNDEQGNVTRRTDAANQFWDSTFDTNGHMTMTEDPFDHGPTFTYSATTGFKLTETTELGFQTSWTYTTGSESAYGSTGTMPAGLVRTITDPLGHVIATNDYNNAGDLTRTTDAAGKQTINTYDEIGRLISSAIVWVNGAGTTITSTTSITYDVMSRPLTVTAPVVVNPVTSVSHQQRTTNVYDNNGNVTQTTVSDTFGNDTPRVTSFAYDLADRQYQVTDAEGGVMSRKFDAIGNVTHVIDQLSRDIETSYDNANRRVDVILHGYVDPAAPAAGRNITTSHTTYDDLGRPKTVTDAIGNVTDYTYDSRGNQTLVVLKNFQPVTGAAYDFVLSQKSFDVANRVVWEESANGLQHVDHTYDNDNRRTVDTVKNGPVTGFTLPDKTVSTSYDAASNITQVAIADGLNNAESRRVAYDVANRPVQTTVENGAVDLISYTSYDQLGNPVRQVDARGTSPTDTAFMTTSFYDNVGVLYRTELPTVTIETVAGSTTGHPTVTTGRNTFGDTTHTVDANGATASSAYDRLGRQVTVTAASYTQPGPAPATLQPTETRVFDAVGNLRFNTDRRGNTTEYQYDSLNRATKQIDPPANVGDPAGVSTVAYGDTGLTLATTTAQGVLTNFTYDKLGRARTVTEHVTDNGTQQILVTSNDYDAAGKQIATTNPAGEITTAVYSRTGQLLKTTDPLGYITSYVYDNANRTIKTISPSGVYQTTTYDLAGRATATATFTPADVSTLSAAATYDKVNNLLTNTDTAGVVTSYMYDASNTLVSVTQPVATMVNAVTLYGYDANGNNTRVTDANNNAWYTTYNSWGLVESRIEPSTTAYPNAADRTYTTRYDNGGLPILELQPGVNVTRTFDNLGRPKTESTADGANRGYVYDLANRPTVLTSGATTINLDYNERSQLVFATGSAGASSFRYDSAGRPSQRVDAAGTTSYSWRQNGQLYQLGDPVTGQTSTYNWAAPATANARQLTSITNTAMTRSYGYDGTDRITSDISTAGASTLWSASYQYNSAGRIATKTIGPVGVAGAGANSYTYNLAGQLTSWTNPAAVTTSYGYDLAGNRTSNGATAIVFDARNRIVSEGTKTYTWTARGTLNTITDGATTNYGFDGLGRMTGAAGVGYTYDALDRINTRGATAFTYSGTFNQPTSDGTTVLSRTPDGSPHAISEGATRLHLLADRHGDVVSTISTAGAVVDSVAYSPWGEPAARQGATALTVGYQSSYTDPTSGLIDMGARWYQASTGTFTNRDTYNGILSTPISLNRYTYANNNPITYFDPDGRMSADAAEKYAAKGYSCSGSQHGPDCQAKVNKRAVTKTADQLQRQRDAAIAEAATVERQEAHGGPGIFIHVDPPPLGPQPDSGGPGTNGHTAGPAISYQIPAGSAVTRFEIPIWRGAGVTRIQYFIDDDDVCLSGTGPDIFCGHGDSRGFASGESLSDYDLGARVRIVLNHETGRAMVIAYPTHGSDGDKAALPINLKIDGARGLPDDYPSEFHVYTHGEGIDGNIAFEYRFVNSETPKSLAGVAPAIDGAIRVQRGPKNSVEIDGRLAQYPSVEIIRDYQVPNGYWSTLVLAKAQESGGPLNLYESQEKFGVIG